MTCARIWMSLLLFTGMTFAQEFEVASIRPSGPKSVRGSEGGPGTKDPTRYTFGRADLAILVLIAYHVEMFQVSSKLPLDRDEFDLVAKVPPGATKDEFRIMLRNLLVERFHIEVRIESRDFPAFEMVLAKGRLELATEAATRLASNDFPKLPPGKPGLTARNSAVRGHMLTQMRGQQQPVSKLAEFLRTAEPRPIVDKTGLTGKYDFLLEFSSDLPNANTDAAATEPPIAPDLNTALREQLGLQLIAKRLPFDVVVVESFNRLPTEN